MQRAPGAGASPQILRFVPTNHTKHMYVGKEADSQIRLCRIYGLEEVTRRFQASVFSSQQWGCLDAPYRGHEDETRGSR